MSWLRRKPKPVSPAPVQEYLGRVVIAGHSFPIQELRLRKGTLEITFHIQGPHPAFQGNYTVFDEDDRGCWQGGEVDVRELREGEFWVWHYWLTVNSVDPRETFRP